MKMYCSYCEHLDTSKKQNGSARGCKYFLKKNKKMVPGNFSCDNFEKSYEKEKIYDEGKEYKEEFKENIGGYVILLVILLILGLLAGIFF